MMFTAGAVFGATCICLVWLSAQVWRIVRDYRQRRRLRVFDVPQETTLLDVVLREWDILREKRAAHRQLKGLDQ